MALLPNKLVLFVRHFLFNSFFFKALYALENKYFKSKISNGCQKSVTYYLNGPITRKRVSVLKAKYSESQIERWALLCHIPLYFQKDRSIHKSLMIFNSPKMIDANVFQPSD